MNEETNSQMLDRLLKEHERLDRKRRRLEFRTKKLLKKINTDYRGPGSSPSSSPI